MLVTTWLFVDSEDLTDAVDAEGWLPHTKTTGLMCMEKLSSKSLAKNNISKRKGQVRFLNILNIYFMNNFPKKERQKTIKAVFTRDDRATFFSPVPHLSRQSKLKFLIFLPWDFWPR